MTDPDIGLRETVIAKAADAPCRVGIFPVDGIALMSYSCIVEPMRAANLLSGRLLHDVSHFAQGEAAQSSGAGLVEPSRPVGREVSLDLLFVVAGGDPFAFDDPAVLSWLGRMARAGVRIGGVSGGPSSWRGRVFGTDGA